MAVRVIRENNRTDGLKKASAAPHIIAGMPLVLASASEVKPYDDSRFDDIPFGIAAQSTELLPFAPADGNVVGEGLNYTDYARGGLVSAFCNGSELELFDDGRGAPYEPADTYVLNRPVYAKENGLITSVIGSTRQKIGIVKDFEGSPVTRLRIKFDI
jgi:hypothetical protein